MKKYICFILSTIIVMYSCTESQCVPDPSHLRDENFFSRIYPNVSFGILSFAHIAEIEKNTIMCFNESKFSKKQIEKETQTLFNNTNSLQVLETFIEDLFIKSMMTSIPDKTYESSPSLLRKHVRDYVTEKLTISDEEVKDYFERNFIWFESSPYEEVKNQIRDLALEDKRDLFFRDYMMNAGKSIPIILSKSWIETLTPSFYNHPIYESLKNGKTSIVIFSYGCCKPDVMLPEIDFLQTYYGQEYNIIHIDSHIDFSFTERCKVNINPTIFVFNKNEQLLFTLLYYHSAQEIYTKILKEEN